MKATALQNTGVLLFVAAAGNTYGLLRFWHVAGFDEPCAFSSRPHWLSYAQVVLGLELFCFSCVLFGAYLAWHLGALARTTPQAIGALGWVLFAYQVVGVHTSWIFLSGFVRLLAAVIAICIGWATWLSTCTPRALAPARRTSAGVRRVFTQGDEDQPCWSFQFALDKHEQNGVWES